MTGTITTRGNNREALTVPPVIKVPVPEARTIIDGIEKTAENTYLKGSLYKRAKEFAFGCGAEAVKKKDQSAAFEWYQLARVMEALEYIRNFHHAKR